MGRFYVQGDKVGSEDSFTRNEAGYIQQGGDLMSPNGQGDNGLIHLKCNQAVQTTVAQLEAALTERGLRIFSRIDHSKAAAEVGLNMRPTEVLLFGNPAVGTPMMSATPSLAIDLPFKALVWEDENGKVWLTYNAPEYLKRRHGIPEPLVKNLFGLVDLLHGAVE